MANFSKAFSSIPEYPEETETKVEGSLPDWLRGTLLKNGPGIFNIGPDTFNHWFDGLAIIQSFRIQDGRVFYKSKHLRSETYKRCMKANRIVVDEFGTTSVPDPCKNIFSRYLTYFNPFSTFHTDNDLVNFIQYGEQIWAATETTILNQIDTTTLDTVNRIDLRKYNAVDTQTAHPHYDSLGNVYNIGFGFGGYKIFVTPNSDIFRQKCNLEGFAKTKVIAQIPPKNKYAPSYFHSFAYTDNYIVFLECPLTLNLFKMLKPSWSKNSYLGAFNWHPCQKVTFHVVRTDDGSLVKRKYTAATFFCFHHANAYEREGCLVLDMVTYPNGDIVRALNLEDLRANRAVHNENHFGKLSRFVLPLSVPPNAAVDEDLLKSKKFASGATAVLTKEGSVHCSKINLSPNKYVEFPRINYGKYNGKPYRYCYSVGRSDVNANVFNEIFKFDVESRHAQSWTAADPGDYVGEPVFVPRPSEHQNQAAEEYSEDDGLLLVPVSNVNDDQLNRLVILDAKDLTTLASAKTERFLPVGFHAHYVESAHDYA